MRVPGRIALYLVAVIIAVTTVGPFLWMISTSLKVPSEAAKMPPELIPGQFTLDNYGYLFGNGILPFGNFLFNSAYITILVVVGRLAFCSLAAYGFARLDFPGRNVAFAFLLATLMIPEMLMVLPLYSAYTNAGLIDTHFPLIVPPIVANTFGTFLLRQFFLTIPKEYDEAALVDGASRLRIFVQIILPLSKPALATVGVLTFINTWNEFFTPLIFLTSLDKFTLPVGLAFFQSDTSTQYSYLMAGATVAVLPILVIYVFAQKYFVQGITMSGFK